MLSIVVVLIVVVVVVRRKAACKQKRDVIVNGNAYFNNTYDVQSCIYTSVNASGGTGRVATSVSCFGGLGKLYRVKVCAVSGPYISQAPVCATGVQCRAGGLQCMV